MNVPFLDLRAQYESIRDEISASIQEVMDTCAFAGGPFVERFEKEWAAYCGAKYAIGVGNGTDALWLALLALGIGPGDEVITVPNTFIATLEAIKLTGASAVLVDVDEKSYTMNPDLLDAAITKRTKAVIPVHLYGQTADMDPITKIARDKGIFVIEDACQAHGAKYKGRRAGAMGDAAAFSFYPGKNLGAYGEAGAITTDRDDVATFVRMFREHGQSKKYYHDITGWNARMDGVQAAVLSAKLRHLDEWNSARRDVAKKYIEHMKSTKGVALPEEAPYALHVFHVFSVRVKERDRTIERLRGEGVACGIHYPVPLHLQRSLSGAGFTEGRFPVSEEAARETLSLPMFPELLPAQIDYVCRSMKRVV